MKENSSLASYWRRWGNFHAKEKRKKFPQWMGVPWKKIKKLNAHSHAFRWKVHRQGISTIGLLSHYLLSLRNANLYKEMPCHVLSSHVTKAWSLMDKQMMEKVIKPGYMTQQWTGYNWNLQSITERKWKPQIPIYNLWNKKARDLIYGSFLSIWSLAFMFLTAGRQGDPLP